MAVVCFVRLLGFARLGLEALVASDDEERVRSAIRSALIQPAAALVSVLSRVSYSSIHASGQIKRNELLA